MSKPHLAFAALTILALALLAAKPDDAAEQKGAKTPGDTPIPVKGVDDWRPRAMAWFTTEGDKARRKEMRKLTRALRQPCKYCHTVDFTGYTEKRLVSQQMMALSAEHGVQCAECHAGKEKLTELGEASLPMFDLARERKVFCDHCHVKQKRFEALTEAGKKYKREQDK